MLMTSTSARSLQEVQLNRCDMWLLLLSVLLLPCKPPAAGSLSVLQLLVVLLLLAILPLPCSQLQRTALCSLPAMYSVYEIMV